ncbi:MAG: hypothetical protein Homavirus31_6, partial [Homavirus sp.]
KKKDVVIYTFVGVGAPESDCILKLSRSYCDKLIDAPPPPVVVDIPDSVNCGLSFLYMMIFQVPPDGKSSNE